MGGVNGRISWTLAGYSTIAHSAARNKKRKQTNKILKQHTHIHTHTCTLTHTCSHTYTHSHIGKRDVHKLANFFLKKYSYQLNLKEGTDHTTWMTVFGLISQVRNKQFKRAHQLVLYFFSLCI